MAHQLYHPQEKYRLHLWQVFVVGRREFSLSLYLYFDHISRWSVGEKEAAASEERLLRYLDDLPVAEHASSTHSFPGDYPSSDRRPHHRTAHRTTL